MRSWFSSNHEIDPLITCLGSPVTARTQQNAIETTTASRHQQFGPTQKYTLCTIYSLLKLSCMLSITSSPTSPSPPRAHRLTYSAQRRRKFCCAIRPGRARPVASHASSQLRARTPSSIALLKPTTQQPLGEEDQSNGGLDQPGKP